MDDELIEAAEPSLRATIKEWVEDTRLCAVMIHELSAKGYRISGPYFLVDEILREADVVLAVCSLRWR